jgi:4-hydroxybenzoate polyprenyltransferase
MIVDYVLLARVPSCVAGAGSTVLGAYLAGGVPALGDGRTYVAAAGIGCAVAVANVVNDIVDVEVDAIEKSARPLPSGRVSARRAWVFAGALIVAAVTLAALVGSLWAVAGMVALLGAAVAYSYTFKDTVLLGNAVVASCASAPIAYGAATTGRTTAPVWIATGLALLFMLAYETLKTISDHDGDAAGGIRTFATSFGPGAAVRLFRALVAALTGVALAAAAATTRPVAYVVAIVVVFAVPAWMAAATLRAKPERPAIGRAVLLMRLAWFLGLVPLWLLR